MLILTYHRIAASAADETGDFYQIPVAALEQQLRLVKEKGYVPGTVDELLSGSYPERRFLVTFDDGTPDHIKLVAPLLDRLHLKGVFFVPTASIGTADGLTEGDMKVLAESGHELGCHSHEHLRLDVLPPAEIERQLSTSCRLLSQFTKRPTRIFAPPGGYTSRSVRSAARKSGLTALRTMRWGLNRKLHLNNLETVPLNASMPLERFANILDGKGLGRLRAMFFAKETLKAAVPIRLYERIRAALFRT